MITMIAALLLQTAAWDEITIDGWSYIGEAEDGKSLMFSRSPDPRNRRIWIRYERSEPGPGGFMSARSLYEANCEDGRMRVAQFAGFKENNLLGDSQASSRPLQWNFVAPDTLGETIFHLICDL